MPCLTLDGQRLYNSAYSLTEGPDFTGKNVPTSKKEVIEVHVEEIDGEDAVYIMEKVD